MRKDSSYYNQSIKVLQNSTLFSGLEESMIEEILGYFTPVTLPKKTIIHYSQTIESVFIILKGRVKLSKINPSNGSEYIVLYLNKEMFLMLLHYLIKENMKLISNQLMSYNYLKLRRLLPEIG
jgi:CRP-like cAMP-binding protein